MAKRRYKRYYKSLKKKNFNYIAKNYNKMICDCAFRLYSSNEFFRSSINNLSTIPVATLLQNSSDFAKGIQMYQSMKLTGLSMEIQFMGDDGNYQLNGNMLIGGLLTTNDGTSIADLTEANKSILIAPQSNFYKRKYWSFNNSATGWIDSASPSLIPGKISFADTAHASSGLAWWSVKVTMYITFKNNN